MNSSSQIFSLFYLIFYYYYFFFYHILCYKMIHRLLPVCDKILMASSAGCLLCQGVGRGLFA